MADTGEVSVDRLRGRLVRCDCGTALGFFRRRRFYSLVELKDEGRPEALLRCPQCGAEHRLPLLVKQWERRR